MELIKVVLIFQAVVTLIIGLVFFSQAIIWSSDRLTNTEISADSISGLSQSYEDLAKRFEMGAYIVLIVAAIELIILSRTYVVT